MLKPLLKFAFIVSLALSVNTSYAFVSNHLKFEGNGTPASEEFAKKCQTLEDQRYDLDVQSGKRFDKVVASNHRPDQDKIYLNLKKQVDDLNQKMIEMKCIKYPVL